MSFDLHTRIEQVSSWGVHWDFKPQGELLVATTPNYTPYDIDEEYNSETEDEETSDHWEMNVKKPGDVGMDLPVRIKGMEDIQIGGKPALQIHPEPPIHNYTINYEEGWVDIPSGGYAELPTALHIKMPDDAWGMIRPRSSTGWKRRLVAFEGTIDSGFTGMLCCLVHNPNQYPVRIMHDDCLTQLVLVKKYELDKVVYVDFDDLPKTERKQDGFGSTGT